MTTRRIGPLRNASIGEFLRTVISGIAIAAGVAMTFAAYGQAPVERAPIRIGFVCPFTGGSADFGNSARLGAELAVKEINEVGGFLGRSIELVARDDRSNPDEGRRIAEELVGREKVAFTVGYCNTGVALKALDVFQLSRSILVVPVATGSAVTAAYSPADSYIFRMAARDSDQAGFLVDEVAGRAGFTRIALFADRSGYGEGGIKDLEKNLAARGLKPVHVARFDVGVSSLIDQIRQARGAGAQAIIGYTLASEFVALLQAHSEGRFPGPVYGSSPLSFSTVHERAGPAAEGARVSVTVIHDLSNERRSSFIARLARHANPQKVSSLLTAAQTYDSVHLMLRVLFQTKGDTSGPALKAALEDLQMPYRGVVTTHEKPFSAADHDAFTRNMIWLGVWRKGEIEFAHSEDAKRSSIMRTKVTR